MIRSKDKRYVRNNYYNRLFVKVITTVVLLLIYPSLVFAMREDDWLVKRYVLSGELGASYFNRNYNDEREESEFGSWISTSLDGYVFDPRIVYFNTDVRYYWSDDLNNGDETFVGAGATVVLFPSILDRGFWRFVPKPIRLRYYFTDDDHVRSSNYGVGLAYRKPNNQIVFFPRGKLIDVKNVFERTYYNNNNQYNNNNNNNNNGLPRGWTISFPELYFDYDRLNYEPKERSFGEELHSDNYNFRLNIASKKGYLGTEYLIQQTDREFSRDQDRRFFEIEHRYDDYYDARRDRFSMINRFIDEDRDPGVSKRYNHHSSYTNRYGARGNFVQVNGDISHDKSDSSEATALALAPSLTTHHGRRLTDTFGISLSAYYPEGLEERYSQTARNAILIRLPWRLSLTQTTYVSNSNQDDLDYGFGIGFDKVNRIIYSGYYDYSFTNFIDSKRTLHRYYAAAKGPIIRRLSFLTDANYDLSHESNTTGSVDEMRLFYRLFFYYNLARITFDLGGTYQYNKIDNGVSDSDRIKTLHLNAASSLGRRTSFVVYSRWLQDDDKTEIQVEPRLYWRFRQLTFSIEYEYRTMDYENKDTLEYHRVYTRLTREFKRFF